MTHMNDVASRYEGVSSHPIFTFTEQTEPTPRPSSGLAYLESTSVLSIKPGRAPPTR